MKEVEVADKAQKVMKELFKVDNSGRSDTRNAVTTSQIRKFLTAVNTITEKVNVFKIQNPGEAEKLPEDLQAEIKYLKIKMAYQIGRNGNRWGNPVKDFADKAGLMDEIDDIKDSVKAYQVFAKYMEALVAFHKFYGGRD